MTRFNEGTDVERDAVIGVALELLLDRVLARINRPHDIVAWRREATRRAHVDHDRRAGQLLDGNPAMTPRELADQLEPQAPSAPSTDPVPSRLYAASEELRRQRLAEVPAEVLPEATFRRCIAEARKALEQGET